MPAGSNHPSSPRHSLQRGVVRDQMGLFDAAAPDFERAVDLSPDNKAALNGAAVNASMRNRTADVIRFTDPVLLQSPDDVDALNSRMLSKYLAKDYAGAARRTPTSCFSRTPAGDAAIPSFSAC